MVRFEIGRSPNKEFLLFSLRFVYGQFIKVGIDLLLPLSKETSYLLVKEINQRFVLMEKFKIITPVCEKMFYY